MVPIKLGLIKVMRFGTDVWEPLIDKVMTQSSFDTAVAEIGLVETITFVWMAGQRIKVYEGCDCSLYCFQPVEDRRKNR